MVARNTTTSRRRKPRVSNLSSKLAALAGASGAALSGEVMADPTYVPTAGVQAAQGISGFTFASPENITSGTLRPPATVGSVNWDVDGNGFADFRLIHGSFSSFFDPENPTIKHYAMLSQNNSNNVLAGMSSILSNLPWRQTFDAAFASVTTRGQMTSNGAPNGAGFTANVPGFFGFKFTDGVNASDFYYGWGSLTIDLLSPGQGFKITEAYYQSTPNTAIQVGDVPQAVPEPSSMALLAAGAAGVAAWRARRKQPSGDA